MGIVFHTLAVAPFISLFLLVKLTLGGYGKLAAARQHAFVSHRHVCKYFL